MKYIKFVLFSILIFSCNTQSTERKELVETVNIEISTESNDQLFSDYFKKISYVKLETLDSSIIGSIDKLIVKNEKIFIGDFTINNAIYVFSLQGKFIGGISNYGKGPNEYENIRDFIVSENLIEILDITNRIYRYNLKFEFINNILLPFNAVKLSKIDTNIYSFYSPTLRETYGKNSNFQLIVYNVRSKNIINSYVKKYYNLNLPNFVERSNLVSHNNTVLFSKTFIDTIYTLYDGVLKEKMIMDFANNKFDINFFKQKYIDGRKRLSDFKKLKNGAYHQANIFSDGEYMITEFNFLNQNNILIYNLETETTSTFSNLINDIDSVSSNVYIKYLYKNQIVSYVNPYNLPKYSRNKLDLDVTDNPVLVFLKLKKL